MKLSKREMIRGFDGVGRTLFVVMAVALVVAVWRPTAHCGKAAITIVLDNKPQAVIVVPESATNRVQTASRFLSHCIEKSTRAKIDIVRESEAVSYKNRVRIWVGQSKYSEEKRISAAKMDKDGFLIAFPDNRNIVLIGASDWGTEFGICEFLERFLGVRWLMPGELGEHVPKHRSVEIAAEEIKREPAFFSRQLSGLRGGTAQSTWAEENRMHGRVQFHHNVLNIFPVDKYRDSRPDFYPILNGQRYIPSDNRDYKWQPCFSAPGVVDAAVRSITEYFDKNPEAPSYSLGINDSGNFCQCNKCLAKVGSKKNYLNRPDYSVLYYTWANQVVEGVLKKYPDKWFGCLAYNNVAEPPSTLRLHPRIVPFLTYDRMKWIVPTLEAEGKALNERWASQSSLLGWYDYVYGTPYMVPRVYFHKMGDYYRYAQQNGVRAMYAEAYPNWGEGPKLYIALKLQWDPYLDVDVVLREWYVAAVGKKAASDLAAYYQIWEDFWTNRIKGSNWFTPAGQYLPFRKTGYLDLVTYDDIERSRRLLESAVVKTETPEQMERAKLILKAFEYYEASATVHLGRVKKMMQPGKTKTYYDSMNQKRLDLLSEFDNDPVLAHPIKIYMKGL